jgi:hypothetical protein
LMLRCSMSIGAAIKTKAALDSPRRAESISSMNWDRNAETWRATDGWKSQ